MSDNRDPRSEELEARVASMAREVMPGRDLWPGIASRLKPRDNIGSSARTAWQPRGWASVGVAVAAGYLLATWLPLASISAWTGQETQPAQLRAELLANIQPAARTTSRRHTSRGRDGSGRIRTCLALD